MDEIKQKATSIKLVCEIMHRTNDSLSMSILCEVMLILMADFQDYLDKQKLKLEEVPF